MSREFRGLAEVKARFYFQDFLEVIRGLHQAQTRISTAFCSLQKEYDAFVPRSRLRLYSHCRPSYGPVALHWGFMITLHPSLRSRAGRFRAEAKVPRYLKRPFDRKWVYSIAKRSDLVDRFLDFERRALVLNEASKVIFRTLRHLKTSTVVRFSPNLSPAVLPSHLDPGTSRQIPEIPVDPTSLELPAEYRQYLRSGWLASFTLALAEEEGYELVREVANNPSAAGVRLELLESKAPSLIRHLRWIHGADGATYEDLTHRLMRQLHIKEDVRLVLSQKELKRRKVEGRLFHAGAALNSVRQGCRAAQLAFTEALAEAKMILLPTPENASASGLPAAG